MASCRWTCSNTEIVCALGCAINWLESTSIPTPEEVVTALPRVGPDLVSTLTTGGGMRPIWSCLAHVPVTNACPSTESRRAPVLAPEPISLSDVYSDVRLIASKLGVAERAASLDRGDAGRNESVLDPAPGAARARRMVAQG